MNHRNHPRRYADAFLEAFKENNEIYIQSIGYYNHGAAVLAIELAQRELVRKQIIKKNLKICIDSKIDNILIITFKVALS